MSDAEDSFIEAGKRFGVYPYVHSEDFIWDFLKNHAQFRGDTRVAAEHYISNGAESAKKLLSLKRELEITETASLLEFASGFGCVTRHLAQLPREFAITACDIHQLAISFIEDCIHVPCIASRSLPEEFSAPAEYDIVFALSFFSHMPQLTWGRWLQALYKCVRPQGYLIFTTHGLISLKTMTYATLDDQGFWFQALSEQGDLEANEYGTTITSPTFVRSQIRTLSGAEEAIFREGDWWGHQDLWAIRKG